MPLPGAAAVWDLLRKAQIELLLPVVAGDSQFQPASHLGQHRENAFIDLQGLAPVFGRRDETPTIHELDHLLSQRPLTGV
jgi:hypothetical protein